MFSRPEMPVFSHIMSQECFLPSEVRPFPAPLWGDTTCCGGGRLRAPAPGFVALAVPSVKALSKQQRQECFVPPLCPVCMEMGDKMTCEVDAGGVEKKEDSWRTMKVRQKIRSDKICSYKKVTVTSTVRISCWKNSVTCWGEQWPELLQYTIIYHIYGYHNMYICLLPVYFLKELSLRTDIQFIKVWTQSGWRIKHVRSSWRTPSIRADQCTRPVYNSN